jgi:DNA-binding NarL/FixJ family response regulator
MRIDPSPVLIVDDDAAYRASVSALLIRAGFVTREAETAEEALASVRDACPSSVLLDVHLTDATGYEVCRELREEYGDTLPIIFVTGERVEQQDRIAGLHIGADEYLIKPVDPDELLIRLRHLIARASAAGSASERRADFGLTRREREVLSLLADGLDQDEISSALVISPRTVETHIQHILPKIGVRNRAQAVAMAYREGLVDTVERAQLVKAPA